MVKRKVYFTLDCAKPGNQYTVEGLHVGDKRSCEFHILLRNGIVPLSFDDENIAVIMNAQKPDGTTISTLCDISEDKKEVVYTLDVQDTTVAGIVNYELFFERLREIGYQGGLILHGIHAAEDFDPCIRIMREKLAKAGI